MLIPSICLIALLGAYSVYEKSVNFEQKNSILAESINRNLSSIISDAKNGLSSLSTSIVRYDPFWYSWVLSNFLQAYQSFERLLYLDPTGKLLATSPQEERLPPTIHAFKGKVTGSPRIISAPIISPISQKLVVYIGIRLENGNVLIGELGIDNLHKHLDTILPAGQGELILCDSYGKLISHPEFSRVKLQENLGFLSIIKDFSSDGQHTTIYKDQGTYYFGTIARVTQSDWLLIIAKPIQEVFLPILSPLLALLTIILCIFFIFAHFLQHRLQDKIVMPLAHFTQSIELTAQGQYQGPGDEESPSFSELAIIEDKFNDMVRQINIREKEIKENEERFRQLVENIHEVYWITDVADNRVIYASPSYEIIWGRTRESLYDNPESFFLAICRDDRMQVVEAINLLRVEGKILDEEFRIHLPDNKERWIRAQAFPVYDEEGVRVRVVGVAEDITERKAIQNALMTAKQDAETASQAKTEFLTNISHELRTPLNGILGMLQLTRDTSLTSEQADYINTAISSSKVLLNVINDILNIAQIEAGRFFLHEQLFSLHEIMETIFKFFTHAIESKDVKLNMEVDPGFPAYLLGDEVRIRQILFNLVGNSVKFTDHGVISIHATPLKAHRQRGTMGVLFTVADTGIGIPSEKIAYVFESFTQVDGTYTRRYQGTGLGLGIVRNLVNYMNGTITVDSEAGEGTTMYITLQLKIPTDEQLDDSPKTEVLQPQTKGLSVLVVEDDRVNQIAISRMLEKMEHEPTCVGDGQKALDILKEKHFDCIFMDIQMPILDGIETTKCIRTDPEFADIADTPIVALTAHAMPDDREHFLKVGMNDYISKPVSFEQLAAVFKRIAS
jgi:PAS domain S-box-containing protein